MLAVCEMVVSVLRAADSPHFSHHLIPRSAGGLEGVFKGAWEYVCMYIYVDIYRYRTCRKCKLPAAQDTSDQRDGRGA